MKPLVMKPPVYVETSVVSYLSARRSTDPIVAGRQLLTQQWWAQKERFDCCTSALVYQEAQQGSPVMAAKRTALLDSLRTLPPSPQMDELAQALIRAAALPSKALQDAEHIALAALHHVSYLVTWNFRHIANPVTSGKIDAVLRLMGLTPPVLCSPDVLLDLE
jgi:hypothetical protein